MKNATYISTNIEHTLVFVRESSEMVNFAIQHFGLCKEVSLTVFDNAEDCEIREEFTMSYQEARLLRDLLNRPEVQKVLDREE